MYAGNAIATVTMTDAVKFLLVRTTAFEKAAETGGSALVESAGSPAQDAGHSAFVSASVAKSDRPDLGSARVVIRFISSPRHCATTLVPDPHQQA
jgi:electron transfer flavoprotein alpha subunit